MKSRQEIMNILEAFDLAGSLRGPGELASVPHRTVARYVANRVAGEPVESTWVAGRSPDIALSGSPATPPSRWRGVAGLPPSTATGWRTTTR